MHDVNALHFPEERYPAEAEHFVAEGHLPLVTEYGKCFCDLTAHEQQHHYEKYGVPAYAHAG